MCEAIGGPSMYLNWKPPFLSLLKPLERSLHHRAVSSKEKQKELNPKNVVTERLQCSR